MLNIILSLLLVFQPATVQSTADNMATVETMNGNVYIAYAEAEAQNAVVVFGHAFVW